MKDAFVGIWVAVALSVATIGGAVWWRFSTDAACNARACPEGKYQETVHGTCVCLERAK